MGDDAPAEIFSMSAPVLVSQFDLLAGAPGGVERLRELILTLAVRGKLVSQEPSDEPVSALLQGICAEKERLIADGRLKPDKASSAAIDQHPFEIPETWIWVSMGEVVEIVRGITFPATEKTKESGPGRIACLRTANVQESIEWDDLLFVSRSFVGREDQFLRLHDIVMSMANSRELVGKVALVDQIPHAESTFGGFLGVLRPWRIDPRYAMALLRSSYARSTLIDSSSQTTNIANISLGKLRPLPFPLPPLAEQARIVARVDELMRLCDALEAKGRFEAQQHARLLETLLGTLTDSTTPEELAANWQRVAEHFDLLLDRPEAVDALEQTVLQLATSGRFSSREPHVQTASVELADQGSAALPFSVPADWSWISLGQLTSLVTSGSRSWKDYYSDEGAMFIRSQDIKYDRLEFDNRAYVRIPPLAEGVRTQVRPGDVLITITGANVGKAAVVDEPLSEAYVSQHVALVRLLDLRIADYLHLWLVNEHGGRHRLLGSSYGAKPGLNLQNIKDLPVPLPPLEEQGRIVARVAELRRLCADLRQRLAASQATQSRLAETLVESALA